MAHPARYDIDPELKRHESAEMFYADLHIQRSPSGLWIKWHDFKDYLDAQRRNKSEETVRDLGMEVVELRSKVQDLQEQIRNIRQATLMLMGEKEKNQKNNVA